MTKKFIVINDNGRCYSHFPDTTGHYATLCQLDGWDDAPEINQSIAGDLDVVTCPECIAIFDVIQNFSVYDIDRNGVRPC